MADLNPSNYTQKFLNEEFANLVSLTDFINLRGEGRNLYNEVSRFVRNYLGGNYDNAQEVMIDVQTNAWKRIDTYDPSRNLRPWLFTLATNACIDYKRRNKRWAKRVPLGKDMRRDPNSESDDFLDWDIKDPGESPLELIESGENVEMIRECLEKLPDMYKPFIIRTHFQGELYREVAKNLGVSLQTVKNRVHEGKLKLRELVENYNGRKAA
jgi:RNA polymerase sigma-70 factor, ECF subfamily